MAGQEYETPARFLFLFSQRPRCDKRIRQALRGLVLEMSFGGCVIIQ